jgi:hypothetical protein
MKNEFDILDSFLQEKVDEANFIAPEQDWLKALDMLQEDEKKKKPFPFWKGFSLSVLVILLGIATYLFSGGKKHQTSKKISNQTQSINHQSIIEEIYYQQQTLK